MPALAPRGSASVRPRGRGSTAPPAVDTTSGLRGGLCLPVMSTRGGNVNRKNLELRVARFSALAATAAAAAFVGALSAHSLTGVLGTGDAHAAPAARQETIRTLAEKVRKLGFEVSLLRFSVGALKTGLPGLYLSPQETYSRLQNLDSRVTAICRNRTVVTSVFQSYSGQVTTTTVTC